MIKSTQEFIDYLKKRKNLRKILVLGSGAVGKTSLLTVLKQQLSLLELPPSARSYFRTFFLNYETLTLADLGAPSLPGAFQVYDVAGQFSLRIHVLTDIPHLVLANLDILLVVFANDNASSFLELEMWMRQISDYYHYHSSKLPAIVLIRNKIDQPSVVDPSLVHFIVQKLNAVHYFELSCLTGEGVDALKTWLTQGSVNNFAEVNPPILAVSS